MSTTEETIENLFKQHADVERVKKIKDYCFVHFATREGARNALENMQGIYSVLFVTVLGARSIETFLLDDDRKPKS